MATLMTGTFGRGTINIVIQTLVAVFINSNTTQSFVDITFESSVASITYGVRSYTLCSPAHIDLVLPFAKIFRHQYKQKYQYAGVVGHVLLCEAAFSRKCRYKIPMAPIPSSTMLPLFTSNDMVLAYQVFHNF